MPQMCRALHVLAAEWPGLDFWGPWPFAGELPISKRFGMGV